MSADEFLFQAKPLATRDAAYAGSVSIHLNAARSVLNDIKWHQVHGSWRHFWTATTRMIIYIDNSRITSGDISLGCRVLVQGCNAAWGTLNGSLQQSFNIRLRRWITSGMLPQPFQAPLRQWLDEHPPLQVAILFASMTKIAMAKMVNFVISRAQVPQLVGNCARILMARLDAASGCQANVQQCRTCGDLIYW